MTCGSKKEVAEGKTEISKTPGEKNPADLMTKILNLGEIGERLGGMFIEIINEPIVHVAAVFDSGTSVPPRVHIHRFGGICPAGIVGMASHYEMVKGEVARLKGEVKEKALRVDHGHRERIADLEAEREYRVNDAKERYDKKMEDYQENAGGIV